MVFFFFFFFLPERPPERQEEVRVVGQEIHVVNEVLKREKIIFVNIFSGNSSYFLLNTLLLPCSTMEFDIARLFCVLSSSAGAASLSVHGSSSAMTEWCTISEEREGKDFGDPLIFQPWQLEMRR